MAILIAEDRGLYAFNGKPVILRKKRRTEQALGIFEYSLINKRSTENKVYWKFPLVM